MSCEQTCSPIQLHLWMGAGNEHFKSPGTKAMKRQSKWSKMSPTCFSLERCMLASAMNVILILSCDLCLELRFKKFWIYYLDDLWRYRVLMVDFERRVGR